MYEIDTLSLNLPAGMDKRANRIARLTAEALAAHVVDNDISIGVLKLPAQRINPARSDRAIAHHLARAIGKAVALSQAQAAMPQEGGTHA